MSVGIIEELQARVKALEDAHNLMAQLVVSETEKRLPENVRLASNFHVDTVSSEPYSELDDGWMDGGVLYIWRRVWVKDHWEVQKTHVSNLDGCLWRPYIPG